MSELNILVPSFKLNSSIHNKGVFHHSTYQQLNIKCFFHLSSMILRRLVAEAGASYELVNTSAGLPAGQIQDKFSFRKS